jgi:hypothetical protein
VGADGRAGLWAIVCCSSVAAGRQPSVSVVVCCECVDCSMLGAEGGRVRHAFFFPFRSVRHTANFHFLDSGGENQRTQEIKSQCV